MSDSVSTKEFVDTMTSDSFSGSCGLRAVKVISNGKRRFDPADKARLIDSAMKPGVSVASLALAHGINANLLRNWVKLRRDRQMQDDMPALAGHEASAFVAVATASPIVHLPDMPARPPSAGMRLTAVLPNGVRLELEDADKQAVSILIEALGRCDVPAG
ncbi:transposase (plasmid) [Agrobacterium radiobacter]|uniref:Transposase n=3 Tax=Agrobacterium TaxID=357 RepID=O52518_AGRTU|nr:MULTISPECIES: transposase [Rhizobium/Agrobacterium group]ASK47085.1 transposase [Agrobacterium radiobacter]AAC72017.1 ynh [Agrobacterium tumefaciens]ASK41620.1 transposase [Agrobacterium tumefaciens]ASK42773.1 transposase [Agrobacterium sp.]KWT81851.1 transposase [Agrobacterium tumefaciens str. B6]